NFDRSLGRMVFRFATGFQSLEQCNQCWVIRPKPAIGELATLASVAACFHCVKRQEDWRRARGETNIDNTKRAIYSIASEMRGLKDLRLIIEQAAGRYTQCNAAVPVNISQ